jgi:electron transport complex protein RnfB
MNSTVLIAVISMGAIGVFFAAFLAFASTKFAVEEDPRIEAVQNVLPGANCGACGFAGCSNFAAAVVAGEVSVYGCPVGGNDVGNKIAQIMGVEGGEEGSGVKKIAKVMCNGDNENCKNKYRYIGVQDCVAASRMAGGGPKACEFGCLGLGTCVRVCPVYAISISKDGIAVIDEEKCIGCEKCVAACPKNVIRMVPYGRKVHVMCNNPEPGKVVRKKCEVGCIACKKCEKACKFDAIHVEGNLAKIDYDKCTECMECVKACPAHTIVGDLENRKIARIIDEKCAKCTICKKNCPFGAIEGEVKQPHRVLEDICVGCGVCYEKCPKDAIEMIGGKAKKRESKKQVG